MFKNFKNDYMIQKYKRNCQINIECQNQPILLKDGKRRKILFQMLSETEWKFNGLSVLERKIIENLS